MIDYDVGSKVVCVNDDFSNIRPDLLRLIPCRPTTGDIYVVREMFPLPSGRVMVLLYGIDNPLVNWTRIGNKEPGFHSNRFRPVISIFRELVESIPQKVRVDA